MGNYYQNELYATEYEDVDALVKQLYNSIKRDDIPDPILAPKAARNGGKKDIIVLQKWAFNSWCNGEATTGWLHVGAKWGNVMHPPLSAFKMNLLAMRGE